MSLVARIFSLLIATFIPAAYPPSLHDALPILDDVALAEGDVIGIVTDPIHPQVDRLPEGSPAEQQCTHNRRSGAGRELARSEEHTSELQSPCKPVCRLLLEKQNH